MAPPSTGRRKIEIRRIEAKEGRQVCFSKRRRGLFNKLSELAIQCGVEVAAVAFSPGNKAFSYGHPSVESVLERFCPAPEPQAAAAVGGDDGDRNQELAELNRVNGELHARLDVEEAKKEAEEEVFAKARAEGLQATAWLDTYVIQMAKEDVVAFGAALGKLQAAVAAHAGLVLQEELLSRLTVHGGGGGSEFGGTSSGTETINQLKKLATLPGLPQ